MRTTCDYNRIKLSLRFNCALLTSRRSSPDSDGGLLPVLASGFALASFLCDIPTRDSIWKEIIDTHRLWPDLRSTLERVATSAPTSVDNCSKLVRTSALREACHDSDSFQLTQGVLLEGRSAAIIAYRRSAGGSLFGDLGCLSIPSGLQDQLPVVRTEFTLTEVQRISPAIQGCSRSDRSTLASSWKLRGVCRPSPTFQDLLEWFVDNVGLAFNPHCCLTPR